MTSHDAKSINFTYEAAAGGSHAFRLKFGYYEPYTNANLENKLRNSGIYVFKTEDHTPRDYPHEIVSMAA